MYSLSKAIADTIVRHGIRPESGYDRCLYGLQLFLTSAVTTMAILVIGLVTGLLPQTMVYIAVYWTIHSVAKSYHCREFYQCFLLTTGIYTIMVLLCLLTNEQTQYIFSWMLWSSTIAVLLAQMWCKESSNCFKAKQYIVYGITVILTLILLVTHITWVAFPLVYGMFVINLMQAKVRGKDE